jgi:hypothetical protein
MMLGDHARIVVVFSSYSCHGLNHDGTSVHDWRSNQYSVNQSCRSGNALSHALGHLLGRRPLASLDAAQVGGMDACLSSQVIEGPPVP